METLLTEAEAIMNSRPLTPLSSDPKDLSALTSGHFLIGEPLTATPDPHAADQNLHPIARWKLVSHLKGEFWKRWTNEYLQTLQHKYKWKDEVHNINPGTMVLIKDDNLPSFQWLLGRIKNVIRGEDGLVRVADVQTAKNILRRPIHKLAPLPVQQSYCYESQEDNHTAATGSIATTPTRKRKSSSSIATLLLMGLFLPIITSSSVIQLPLKGNPSIYFERIGMANVISSSWNLINYFDLRPSWNEGELANYYVSLLATTCSSLHESSCKKTVDQLRQQLQIIDATNQLLKPGYRSKRGAFNFVGNMANGLFGLLDSEYAEKLEVSIENMKQNQETLNRYIQNQTSYLDRTLSIMKKNHIETEKEFNLIEKLIHKTTKELSNLTQQMHDQKLAVTFNELALQALMQVSHFRSIQNAVVDIMTDAHHERINPELLTPMELRDELGNINQHTSRSMKLPLPMNDITQYYRLMSISHRITGNYIIFSFQIPLVSPTEFELLKLTAIPWLKNNTFYQLKLSTPYLLIDLLRAHYYVFSHEEIQQCVSIDKALFFCPQVQPLLNPRSSTARCELSILKEVDITDICHSIIIGDGPHWFKLQEHNAWIFFVGHNTVLNVVCNNNPSNLEINGSGILKLGEDCLVKAQRMTLAGHTVISRVRQIAYVPPCNISKVRTQTEHLMNNYSVTYHSHQEDIDNLKKDLNEFKTVSLNTVRPHDIHLYGLGYSLLIIAVFSIVFIMIIYCKRIRQSMTAIPQPAPRTNMATRGRAEDAESHVITVI